MKDVFYQACRVFAESGWRVQDWGGGLSHARKDYETACGVKTACAIIAKVRSPELFVSVSYDGAEPFPRHLGLSAEASVRALIKDVDERVDQSYARGLYLRNKDEGFWRQGIFFPHRAPEQLEPVQEIVHALRPLRPRSG